MKKSLLLLAMVGLGVWQSRKLAALQAVEIGLRAHADTAGNRPMAPTAVMVNDGRQSGMPEAEFANFQTAMLQFRDLAKAEEEALAAEQVRRLSEPLSRVNGEQLASIFALWTHGEPITKALLNESPSFERFVIQAAVVNPFATLDFLQEHSYPREELQLLMQIALGSLFRNDLDALVTWAAKGEFPSGAEKLCAMWKDAATVALGPTVENVRRIMAHRSAEFDSYLGRMRNEIVVHLPNQEMRVQFFQALRVAGGESKHLEGFLRTLAKRISFSQLAQIADVALAPDPAILATTSPSPRFRVAFMSRDGTPEERWNWLVSREGDRPSGKNLNSLVSHWCEDNYPGTAGWVRSLPNGAERTALTEAIVTFLNNNECGELANEWKAMPR